MKFEWSDNCRIVNTGDPALDGTEVVVDGIAFSFQAMSGNLWIVRRTDHRFFETRTGKWKSIVMTESCLEELPPESFLK